MSYIPSTLTPALALSRVMDDRVASTRITSARLLANLAQMNRIVTARKQNLDWGVELGGEAAGVGTLLADTVNTAGSVTTPANLKIGTYRVFHRFDVSRLDIQEATQIAPSELQNLFGNIVDRGLNAIARRLNGLLYTGTGIAADAGVYGLNYVLNPLNAYAGIDPAVLGLELWRPTILDLSAAFDRDAMLLFDEQVAVAETFYDAVVMHPSKARLYQLIFDDIAGNRAVIDRAEATGLKRADLGHGGRFYNGFPIIEDPMASNDRIYLMQTQDITLHCFELANNPQGAISDIAVNSSYGIPIHIAELPSSNSAKRTFEMYVIPQLQVFNRKSAMSIID